MAMEDGKQKIKDQILNLLKTQGAQTAAALAAQLHVSPMAIRQHLQQLQLGNWVTYQEERQPIGRPVKLWQLSARSLDRFPNRHADLMVELLSGVVARFGTEGLEQLMADRSQRQIETYLAKLSESLPPPRNSECASSECASDDESAEYASAGYASAGYVSSVPLPDASLPDASLPNASLPNASRSDHCSSQLRSNWRQQVAAIAVLRTQEGYMAEAIEQSDGSLLLVENHCPICIAAQHCPQLCRSELETFQAVLGSTVQVERMEHLLQGDRRCAYRISPVSPVLSGAPAPE